MSVLKKQAGDKLRPITIRIPTDLAGEIEAVRDEARRAGLEFPVAEICRAALQSSVRAARAELSRAASDGAR